MNFQVGQSVRVIGRGSKTGIRWGSKKYQSVIGKRAVITRVGLTLNAKVAGIDEVLYLDFHEVVPCNDFIIKRSKK